MLAAPLRHGAGCSTKAGFIADDIADNLLLKTEKYGGISKGDIVGGNCIHPNCLKNSLSRSLPAMHLTGVSLNTAWPLQNLADAYCLCLFQSAGCCRRLLLHPSVSRDFLLQLQGILTVNAWCCS